MSEENGKPTVDIENDLDAFEDAFYERTPVETEEKVEEIEEEVEDDLGEVDTPATDEDEEAEAEEAEDEEEDEPEVEEPKGKKNRKSAQERINELTAKLREGERREAAREAALQLRIEQLEAASKEKNKTEEPALREMLPADAPSPDAKDKDGEPLYELGEFDPKFIRDLTKFTIEQETKAVKVQMEQERQQQDMDRARKEISDAWIDRVDEAEKTMPDLRENMKTLTDTFAGLEQNYGEYLASTIMLSEIGPQIMNYLSQNIGEAQQIVASGPAAATLALGRLEAKLSKSTEQEPKRNTKKVSEAAPPPEDRSRGARGQFTVSPDTDDLEAFEREFFKK